MERREMRKQGFWKGPVEGSEIVLDCNLCDGGRCASWAHGAKWRIVRFYTRDWDGCAMMRIRSVGRGTLYDCSVRAACPPSHKVEA